MLRVHRDQLPATPAPGGQHERPAGYQALFVGQRQPITGFESGNRSAQAGGSDDAVEDRDPGQGRHLEDCLRTEPNRTRSPNRPANAERSSSVGAATATMASG